jgi:hypothetical protein
VTTDDEMTEESTTEASDADTPEAAPIDSEVAEAVASEPVATEKESAPADAEASDTGAEVAEDEAQDEAQGEAYDPTVGGAAAHILGISRPQDEYGTREIDRDAMSDEELLAMGVEVDDGPGAKLLGVFLALTIILILSGVATAGLFGWVKDTKRAGISNRVHPTLAGSRAEAAEVLNAYEQLEAAEDSTAAPGFRVPIDVAMDILVENDRLLARHPMGASEAALEPPSFEGFEAPRVAVTPLTRTGPGVPAVPAHPPIHVVPVENHAGHGHDDHAGHGHDDHAGHGHDDHAEHGHDDHAEHGHDDHAEHGHDDHAGHGHDDHAGHDHQ